MKLSAAKVSEAGFTDSVIAYARLRGWVVAHFRPARTAKGWRTAVSGDGAGWPDLFMVRDDRAIAAELKIPPNKLSAAQCAWVKALEAAGIPVYVWTPDDWESIVGALG